MADVQRKLVHNQFNSPIGLYSQRNIQETLDRELRTLSNGAVGINFDDPATVRTGNLANSAVLRALEEEEKQQKPGVKRVAWPPPPESHGPNNTEQEPAKNYQQQPQNDQFDVVPNPNYIDQSVVQQQFSAPISQKFPQRPQPLNSFTTNNTPITPSSQVSKPVFASPTTAFAGGQALLSPQVKSPASQFANAPLSPSLIQTNINSGGSPRGWAHVRSPLPLKFGNNQQQPNYTTQPPFQFDSNQYNFGAQQTQYQPQTTQAFRPLDSAPVTSNQPNQPREYQIPIQLEDPQGYPGYVTQLRKEAPISQKPHPIYVSQPVAASFQGGINMRGDQKWPPEEVKKQSEVDNEQRKKLAHGPAFRPKRVAKDYSQFFAKHALNSTYPGYRAPPGTQHVADDSSQM